jgi:hypothetical protein
VILRPTLIAIFLAEEVLAGVDVMCVLWDVLQLWQRGRSVGRVWILLHHKVLVRVMLDEGLCAN